MKTTIVPLPMCFSPQMTSQSAHACAMHSSLEWNPACSLCHVPSAFTWRTSNRESPGPRALWFPRPFPGSVPVCLPSAEQQFYVLLASGVFLYLFAPPKVYTPTLQIKRDRQFPEGPQLLYLGTSGIYRATWDWSQWVVSTRILHHLQHPVTHQSRLQWIHPHTYFKL